MFKKVLIAAGLFATALAMPAQANDKHQRDFGDILGECGLGAMLFPDDRTIAIITNITWDLGTTAVSSNSSSAGTCKGGTVEAAKLVIQSYPELENDFAAGEGEHLAALMSVANCSDSAIPALRADFADVVSADGYAGKSQLDKAEAMYGVVAKNGACAI